MSRADAPVPKLNELLDAIVSGNVKLVKILADSLREKINDSVTRTFYPPSSVEDDAGITSEHTALGTAVERGKLEMVRILLDVGAIPSADLLTDSLDPHLHTGDRDVVAKKITSELAIYTAFKYGDIPPEKLRGMPIHAFLGAIATDSVNINALNVLFTILPDESEIRREIVKAIPQSPDNEAKIRTFRDFKNLLETKFEKQLKKEESLKSSGGGSSGGGGGGGGAREGGESETILNPKQAAGYTIARLMRDNFLEQTIATFRQFPRSTSDKTSAGAVFGTDLTMGIIGSFLSTLPLCNLTKSQQDVARNALADFLFPKQPTSELSGASASGASVVSSRDRD